MVNYEKSQLYWIRRSYKLIRGLGTGWLFFCDLKARAHFSNDQSSIKFMAAIKATKKVTSAEIEKGVPLSLLTNDPMLVTQRTREQREERVISLNIYCICTSTSIHPPRHLSLVLDEGGLANVNNVNNLQDEKQCVYP